MNFACNQAVTPDSSASHLGCPSLGHWGCHGWLLTFMAGWAVWLGLGKALLKLRGRFGLDCRGTFPLLLIQGQVKEEEESKGEAGEKVHAL